MNILQKIFNDHYEEIEYILHPRPVVMENIEKMVKSLIYSKNKDGFYVYAKPNVSDPDTVVKYISRYLARPVIATSRIDSYDGESVTFHYNKHEDDSYVQETLPVLDFITWRCLILLSFGYDPLECPKYKHKMVFLELCFAHKRVPLEELYERTMAKYHCRSSG